uniref:18S rRNA (Guanine-N(7))-methyltransferase n=1 Tax=Strombidium rassoulzadegani TaxID=1082188 RepID=A0A7S3FTT0_9SPIT|mmetsp:Transcript_17651/g.29823  ORF Transcript_17651/g.29823 Transcript_17651/m.29823 type:complete len:283 (+) Transcript_17651:120-968(+)
MVQIQRELTERALEILAIPEGSQRLILDVGTGTSISGQVLSEYGHMWVGTDISRSMLEVATTQEDLEGDLVHADMGHGFGFRPGTFDGAVSISALQWLCSAEKKCQNPMKRLATFFSSLYACLVKGARCAFQFYPSNPEQVEMITTAALKNGFTGGMIVDYPNSQKAKKYYLFLMAGFSEEIYSEAKQVIMPQAKSESDDEEDSDEEKKRYKPKEQQVGVYGKRKNHTTRQIFKQKNRKSHSEFGQVKSKSWIMAKKERARKQGKQVAADSKFSGRKRKDKF